MIMINRELFTTHLSLFTKTAKHSSRMTENL